MHMPQSWGMQLLSEQGEGEGRRSIYMASLEAMGDQTPR